MKLFFLTILSVAIGAMAYFALDNPAPLAISIAIGCIALLFFTALEVIREL